MTTTDTTAAEFAARHLELQRREGDQHKSGLQWIPQPAARKRRASKRRRTVQRTRQAARAGQARCAQVGGRRYSSAAAGAAGKVPPGRRP